MQSSECYYSFDVLLGTMERIDELYVMLDELEENLADLLGDISEVIEGQQ